MPTYPGNALENAPFAADLDPVAEKGLHAGNEGFVGLGNCPALGVALRVFAGHGAEIAVANAIEDAAIHHAHEVFSVSLVLCLGLGIGHGLVEPLAPAERREGMMGLGKGDCGLGKTGGTASGQGGQAARLDGAGHQARHLRHEIDGHPQCRRWHLGGGAGFCLCGDFGLKRCEPRHQRGIGGVGVVLGFRVGGGGFLVAGHGPVSVSGLAPAGRRVTGEDRGGAEGGDKLLIKLPTKAKSPAMFRKSLHR